MTDTPDKQPALEAIAWPTLKSAPRDGTWILIRGRNAADHPMVPVVCCWGTGFGRYPSARWVDSATFADMTDLEADVPHRSSADWLSLTDLNRANEIIAGLEAENARLTALVDRLRDFCSALERDDFENVKDALLGIEVRAILQRNER